MANAYRTIKLSYNTTVEQITIKTQYEDVERRDISITRITESGARYRQITGGFINWEYGADFVDADFYNFFYNAYLADKNGTAVTFSFQNDDLTFTDYSVIVYRPEYNDDTVDSTDKIYRDFSVRLESATGQ